MSEKDILPLIEILEGIRKSPAYQNDSRVRLILDGQHSAVNALLTDQFNGNMPHDSMEYQQWLAELTAIVEDIMTRVEKVTAGKTLENELREHQEKAWMTSNPQMPSPLTYPGFPILAWPAAKELDVYEQIKLGILANSYPWSKQAFGRVCPQYRCPTAEEVNAILSAIPAKRLKNMLVLMEKPAMVLLSPASVKDIHRAVQDYAEKVVHKKKHWQDPSAYGQWGEVALFITEGSPRPLSTLNMSRMPALDVRDKSAKWLEYNDFTHIGLRVHSMLTLAQLMRQDARAGSPDEIIDSYWEKDLEAPATIIDESEFMNPHKSATMVTTGTFLKSEIELHYRRHGNKEALRGIGIRPTCMVAQFPLVPAGLDDDQPDEGTFPGEDSGEDSGEDDNLFPHDDDCPF